MTDLNKYKELNGIEFRPQVKRLMELFAECWEECRAEDCGTCRFRHGKNYYRMLLCMSERYAEKLIANDVAPVRHGRWIFEPDGGTRCSECNKRVRDVTGGQSEPVDLSNLPYCPKCGARMNR